MRKSQYFPFWMFSAKQGHYWYHFYNVFVMTRSVTGDWTRYLQHSKPALYHLAIEEAVLQWSEVKLQLSHRNLGLTQSQQYSRQFQTRIMCAQTGLQTQLLPPLYLTITNYTITNLTIIQHFGTRHKLILKQQITIDLPYKQYLNNKATLGLTSKQ